MNFISIQREADCTLRDFAAAHDVPADVGTDLLLRDLRQRGLAPPSSDQFVEVLRAVKTTARGIKIDPTVAAQAVAVGRRFIAELSGVA